MSGTSLDGIDVAVIEIRGRKWHSVAFRSKPYPKRLRERILASSNAVTHTAEISRLNFLLAEEYAKAVIEADIPEIDLIGCHGQTVFHEGTTTLQLGDAGVIAERTGIPVVNNFRTRDIAAGGQGAPLVPYVDFLLFRHAKLNRVALNIGGIANVTILPACVRPEEVVAFDTGPGNMVMDQLVSIATNGELNYDRDGRMASRGRLNVDLLEKLMSAPYFRKKPPKTAGREQFGSEFVADLMATGLPVEDLITTATTLTAATISQAITRTDELIVSGGGARNPSLMAAIASFLPKTKVLTSADFGINVDAKEAIAFAILAYETWRGKPGNLPSATGAKHPVVLGSITR